MVSQSRLQRVQREPLNGTGNFEILKEAFEDTKARRSDCSEWMGEA